MGQCMHVNESMNRSMNQSINQSLANFYNNIYAYCNIPSCTKKVCKTNKYAVKYKCRDHDYFSYAYYESTTHNSESMSACTNKSIVYIIVHRPLFSFTATCGSLSGSLSGPSTFSNDW